MTFLASQREIFDLILSPQLTPISKLPVQGMGGYDLWMDGWMDGGWTSEFFVQSSFHAVAAGWRRLRRNNYLTRREILVFYGC